MDGNIGADTIGADVDEVIPVKPGGTLFVQIDKGSVDIESHERSEVRVVVEAGGISLDERNFELTQAGRDVHLDMVLGSWLERLFMWSKVRVRALVPSVYAVDVRTRGGRIEVRDIGGHCALHTSGGKVDVSGIEGDATLRTSGSSIRVEDVGGDVTAVTFGGKLRLRRVDGDCDIQTSGGSIRLEDVLGRIDAKSSGGSIRAQFGHYPSGRIQTSGGSIQLEYPRGTGVALDARASGGSIEIAPDILVDGRADKSRVEADLDGGGLDLELKTSGGSIRVETWSAPPLPSDLVPN